MPASAVDARYLTDLRGDYVHATRRDARDIDLDVEHASRGKLRQNLPGNGIQVLESLENSRERPGVCVSDHPQA
jgi:hypothetical protein